MNADYAISAFLRIKHVNGMDDANGNRQMQDGWHQVRKAMQLAQYALMEIHSLRREVSCMVNMMLTIRTSFLHRCLMLMMM